MATSEVWAIGFMLLLVLAVGTIVLAHRRRQCDACRVEGRVCWHDDERHIEVTGRDENWATVTVTDGKGLMVTRYRVPRHPINWGTRGE